MTNGEMLLIGLPASPLLAAVVLAWWGERGRGSTGAGITAAAGLVTAIAAASAVWLVDLPVTGEWAGGRFAFDHLTAAMIGALGLGVAWLGASALSATPERRCLLLLMLSTVVAFWLSDSLWLALGWQSLLLALAFLSLGCEADWPMAGPAARQLWLTTACADLALLLASVGWLLDASVATFSEAGTDSAVAEVAARSAASVPSL